MSTTLTKIEGVLLELKGSRTGKGKGGPWTLHNFIVLGHSAEGEDGILYECSVFQNNDGTAFDTAWVGKDVAFEAEHNAKYDNYAVKTAIAVSEEEGDGPVVIPPPAKKAVAKRGRPVTSKPAVQPTAKATVVTREDFAGEAESSVEATLTAAKRVAKKVKLIDPSLGDLVLLGDMIGRTNTAIFLDSKNRR